MQITKNVLSFALLLTFILATAAFVCGQNNNSVFNLTTDSLKQNNAVDLSKAGWEYCVSDNPNLADVELDETNWQILTDETYHLEKLGQSGWRGAGWFRLRFKTDDNLRGKVLGLTMTQVIGASEIYLDNYLVRRFGEIGTDRASGSFVNIYGLPLAVTLDNSDEHVLAVRFRSGIQNYETFFSRWIYSNNSGDGFNLAFTDVNETIERREQTLRSNVSTAISRASIYLAVGLLYLLLFCFYPPLRANLYFGIFAFLTAVNTFIIHLQSLGGTIDLATLTIYRVSSRFLFVSYSLAFLLFLYRAFLPGVPRFFVFVSALWIGINIAALLAFESRIVMVVFGVMTVGFIFESLRVMWLAVMRNRLEGAWIVALGVLTALIGPLRYLAFNVGLGIPKELDFYLVFFFNYGMLTAVAIYLARQFARTNKDLTTQLVHVQNLSARALEHERTEAELRLKHEQERAEYERRAKELEEARQLQLSLLPKKLPQIPDLEIAAYMRPASEVGGDYYDFHLSSDDTLTIAVGDATGHGLKAGTMVTATKSLFNNLADESSVVTILNSSSAALKKMNLRGMFMAMTMLKLKNDNLSVGCAGMPPLLVYRNKSKQVEEVAIRAMPLGGPFAANYEQRELQLEAGDLIVVMSDGFPEMFNQEGEMLGFERAGEILPEIADKSAQEIVDYFVQIGERWANGRPPDDDVTFVVLKVKKAAVNL